MDTFQLFNFSGSRWIDLSASLKEKPLDDMDGFLRIIDSNPHECKSLEKLLDIHSSENMLNCFNFIREIAFKLPEQFPTGEIRRLNVLNPVVNLTRRQVLVLLCHMFLCTLKESPENAYWVTFKNWLTDGRDCAVSYLQCLYGYFEQCMEMEANCEFDAVWEELITFESHHTDPQETIQLLYNGPSKPICIPTIYSNGKIGDGSTIELDFANKNIGFGIYGTQEEILFGSSTEMCVAMLFCDTMRDNEAITIRGARKIGKFSGYGSTVKFDSFVAVPDICRNNRIMIAIDALDCGDYEDPYSFQASKKNLERELVKLVCGFGTLAPGSCVDTGNWGCGAFGGDKYLKAILQMIAASVANVQLNFFTFGDSEFQSEFDLFAQFCKESEISAQVVWESVNKFNFMGRGLSVNGYELFLFIQKSVHTKK